MARSQPLATVAAMHGPDEPRCVVDPTTGRPILMAPLRQQRPMHTGPQASTGGRKDEQKVV
jgi:hypothetical protein